ncbi:MAG: beta-lactamase family protein [bacterium]|nr:beta-lactamase family protein [bacterium]
MKSSLLLSCLVLMCAAPPAAAQEPFPFQAQVDALVQPYLEHREIGGLSIGVVHEGKSWTLHYGQLGEIPGETPDDHTVYEVGSVSKVFTSLLLAKAVVDEQLTLDQTIGSLLPSLKEKNPRIANGVSLQHLSQHMSGLPRLPNNLRPADQNNPYADYDRTAMMTFMETVFPDFKPGERYGYSNFGVGLLGELLSTRAKSSYGELLQKVILGPMAMQQSGLSLQPAPKRTFAKPYCSGLFPSHTWSFDVLAGCGAVQSTIGDMLLF